MSSETRRWLTPPGVAARLKSDRAVPTAKRLRKTMTRAEKALWSVLRRVAPEEAHFREAGADRTFIVDFASHAAKLVVELEGGAHDAPAERHDWIEGRGYQVLRFPERGGAQGCGDGRQLHLRASNHATAVTVTP